MKLNIEVPKLEHDAMMLKRFGHTVSLNGRLERRIVATLIAHLAEHGWQVASVYDGDIWTAVSDAKGAMELVFNLDEARLRFSRANCLDKHVLLVLGNGQDIITDYTYSTDDFQAAMEAFDVEKILIL